MQSLHPKFQETWNLSFAVFQVFPVLKNFELCCQQRHTGSVPQTCARSSRQSSEPLLSFTTQWAWNILFTWSHCALDYIFYKWQMCFISFIDNHTFIFRYLNTNSSITSRLITTLRNLKRVGRVGFLKSDLIHHLFRTIYLNIHRNSLSLKNQISSWVWGLGTEQWETTNLKKSKSNLSIFLFFHNKYVKSH